MLTADNSARAIDDLDQSVDVFVFYLCIYIVQVLPHSLISTYSLTGRHVMYDTETPRRATTRRVGEVRLGELVRPILG